MDWQDLSQEMTVRTLTLADKEKVLELYETNPLYFHHCPPAPSLESVEVDMTSFPPSKTSEDKVFLGFFKDSQLVAVLDIIQHYPQEGTVFIGLFMVHAAYQGRGWASRMMRAILQGLSATFQTARLAFVKTNPQARQFWLKQGFQLTGEEKQLDDYAVALAQRILTKE